MREVILATGVGFFIGVVFALLRLPVPAPPTLAGLMGIVGLFLGYMVTNRFFPH